MDRLCLPKKVYFKDGSTEVALRELKEIYHIGNALIVADAAAYAAGAGTEVMRYLQKLGIRTAVLLTDHKPVTAELLVQSETVLREFEPEAVVAVGDAMVMGAGKLIRLLAEHPDLSAAGLLRAVEEGSFTGRPAYRKILSIMIPTSFAEGAQNTPCAELAPDGAAGVKTYRTLEMLADMTVTDVRHVRGMTPEEIHFEGTGLKEKCLKALENSSCSAYVAGFLKEAVKAVDANLAAAEDGSLPALEKLHNAGSIAGNAFGNI